jgi:hypothetical protein
LTHGKGAVTTGQPVAFFEIVSEAFEAAMPGSGVPNEIIHPGETKLREYFHLESGT